MNSLFFWGCWLMLFIFEVYGNDEYENCLRWCYGRICCCICMIDFIVGVFFKDYLGNEMMGVL